MDMPSVNPVVVIFIAMAIIAGALVLLRKKKNDTQQADAVAMANSLQQHQQLTPQIVAALQQSVPVEVHQTAVEALGRSIPAAQPPEPAPAANPFGATDYGQPFDSQEKADAWRKAAAERAANLGQWEKDFIVSMDNGPIPLGSISGWTADTSSWTREIRDTDFLWWAQVQGNMQNAFHKILSGKVTEVNVVINDSEHHYLWLMNQNVDFSMYQGPCRAAYEQLK